MKKTNNILWGIILIIIGTIIGLNSLEITNINIFFDGWWTLFIIVPSFIDLMTRESKTGAIVGLVIGTFLFLACQDILDFTLVLKLIVPISIIVIGLSFIFKDTLNKKIKEEIKKIDQKDKKEYYSTFSNQKINIEDNFENTEINAIFGGMTLDLTNAKITKDIIIEANAIFGGITIYTPKNVNVKVSSTPIFGGVSNEIKKQTNNEITIFIKANAIFGGVEIK